MILYMGFDIFLEYKLYYVDILGSLYILVGNKVDFQYSLQHMSKPGVLF